MKIKMDPEHGEQHGDGGLQKPLMREKARKEDASHGHFGAPLKGKLDKRELLLPETRPVRRDGAPAGGPWRTAQWTIEKEREADIRAGRTRK